eukprot:scaffold4562_cov178-Amphora_coffeaeformis.AAC.6
MVVALILYLCWVPLACTFTPFIPNTDRVGYQWYPLRGRENGGGTFRPFARVHTPLRMTSADTDNDDGKSSRNNPLSETSRLSHAMLKVKSVDETCSYWTEKGGSILQSRQDDDGSYLSAFVALGNGKTTDNCFALELVRTEKESKIGNVINYIGVSLLLQFQGNLQGLISGKDKAKKEGDEPNGFFVKSCASSPGDYLCRLCLKSNNLEKTQAFYELVLGMELAAGDDSQICLRYAVPKNKSNTDGDGYGVPITIVFEGTNEKLDFGTSFDHLAVRTTTSINELFERFQKAPTTSKDDVEAVTIYMNPVEMFGMTVMGLRDPNGYKVVLAGPA